MPRIDAVSTLTTNPEFAKDITELVKAHHIMAVTYARETERLGLEGLEFAIAHLMGMVLYTALWHPQDEREARVRSTYVRRARRLDDRLTELALDYAQLAHETPAH